MRKIIGSKIENIQQVRANLLQWGSHFNHFMMLDSNSDAGYADLPQDYINFQLLAAAGTLRYQIIESDIFDTLKKFVDLDPDWYFMHLSFDAKTETHGIPAQNPDPVKFPAAFIFVPLWVISLQNNELHIHFPSCVDDTEAQSVLQMLTKRISDSGVIKKKYSSSIPLKRMLFDDYAKAFHAIQQHLLRGDIYEMNFCINFSAHDTDIDPYAAYLNLCNYSPAPFAVFYKHNHLFLLSASPERFLKKSGSKILSQPIKGTTARGYNSMDDMQRKHYLQNNTKERAENIMITDLVRNDLSQFAQPSTVRVSDLCGVYTFRHVHQMISTIECQLRQDIHFIDAIRLAFPMGSMTGAPKHNALKFIEQYENFNRGLFSGSVGYINPHYDFDLNVIIRSIIYNSAKRYLSVPAGSAITVYSNAQHEFDECCLKAQALLDVIA